MFICVSGYAFRAFPQFNNNKLLDKCLCNSVCSLLDLQPSLSDPLSPADGSHACSVQLSLTDAGSWPRRHKPELLEISSIVPTPGVIVTNFFPFRLASLGSYGHMTGSGSVRGLSSFQSHPAFIQQVSLFKPQTQYAVWLPLAAWQRSRLANCFVPKLTTD